MVFLGYILEKPKFIGLFLVILIASLVVPFSCNDLALAADDQYNLHVQISGSGITNATGDHVYPAGTITAVSANASSGWIFSHWLLNDSSIGSLNPYGLVVSNNFNLTAVFMQKFLFDGFESGSFNQWNGVTTTTNETATVTSSQVHEGAYGASFVVSQGTGTRRSYCYLNVNSLSEMNAKAYIHLPSTLSMIANQSLWLIQLIGENNSIIATYGMRADASGLKWAVQSGNWPYAIGSSAPSSGGWYLMEAYFVRSATGKTLILCINGVEAAYLNQNTTGAAAIMAVRFGVGYYAGNSALTIAVDDVTISSQSTLPILRYNLSIGVQGSGSTNPAEGTYQYYAGTNAIVLANSAVGWQFTEWLLNGTSWSSANPCSLTMNTNYNLTAVFTENAKYNLHVQISGSGLTNSTGDTLYDAGANVSILSQASNGWLFSHWLLNGTNAGSTNPLTLNIGDNLNFTAVFSQTFFADNYETASFGQWSGATTTANESASVTSNLVHGGAYGASFVVAQGAGARRSYCYLNVNGLSELCAKAYVYLPSDLSMAANQSLWLIQLVDVNNSVIATFGMRADNSGLMKWAVQSGNWPFALGSLVPSNGGWYLIEAYFTHANAGKTITLTVNGMEMAYLNQNTSTAANVSSIRCGIGYYNGVSALTIAIDDVSFSSQAASPILRYSLAMSVQGAGNINPTAGSHQHEAGSLVSLSASANTGWSFSHWLINGTNVGSTNPYQLTMNNHYYCTAVFSTSSPLNNAYMVVKGEDGTIYYKTYDTALGVWLNWNALPGSTIDSAAATVCGNELHVVVRGSDGSSLWHGYVDLTSSSFYGWTSLAGSTPSAPTLTSNGTHIAVIVRGGNNLIYYKIYDANTHMWDDWQIVPFGSTADSAAASLVGNSLHIAVKGLSGDLLWYCNGNLASGEWSPWSALAGTSPSPPTFAANSTDLALVVRGGNDLIYYKMYRFESQIWGSWLIVPNGSTSNRVASTFAGDLLQIIVLGQSGGIPWHGIMNLEYAAFLGWRALDGSTYSPPVLTS